MYTRRVTHQLVSQLSLYKPAVFGINRGDKYATTIVQRIENIKVQSVFIPIPQSRLTIFQTKGQVEFLVEL